MVGQKYLAVPSSPLLALSKRIPTCIDLRSHGLSHTNCEIRARDWLLILRNSPPK